MKAFFSAWRRSIAALLVAGAAMLPAHGAVPLHLRDYTHTAWTVRDGAPTEVRRLAQTPDGLLWLATSNGLYSFDGVTFSAVALPPAGREIKTITELKAGPNGELWVGDTVGGVYVVHEGRVRNVSPQEPFASVRTLAFDADGSVWAALSNGLQRYDGKTWQRQQQFQGGAPAQAWSVLADQYGQVWTNNQKGVFLLDRASGQFRHMLATTAEGDLIQSPDGRVWLAESGRLTPLPMPPQQAQQPRPEGYTASRWLSQFDRGGNLWSRGCGPGLCFLPRAAAAAAPFDTQAAQRLDQPWQLSSLAVNAILEDREGNVWLATQNGIDRFRGNKVLAAPIPGERGIFSMASDTEGGVWVAEPFSRTAYRMQPGGEAVADRSEPFSVVANDRDGALLLAGARTLVRRYQGRETRLALPPGPDGKAIDLDVFGVLDDGKVLWIASPQTNLMGYVDGRWQPRTAFNLPPKIYVSSYGGRPGTLWLGCGDGSVVFYDDGRLSTYDGSMVGTFSSIHAGPETVISGAGGLAVLQDGKFRLLQAADPEVLLNVSGLAIAPNGDRWLNGRRGIVHILAADWRAALASPAHVLRYRLLGSHEGYPGSAMLINRLHSIFTAANGEMWFMASGGIVRLDPSAIPRNAVAPQPRLRDVAVGERSYPAAGMVQLPAGTQSFQVAYTAPSLVRADGVRFQYQLAGVDAGLQDAGTRRSVRYTNVGPGSYRFAITAINEDGVAGAADSSLVIAVAPTLTQTNWFRALALTLACAALYLLYRYRLHRAMQRTAEKMEVRMAERERIARTLHDTFLQSVHAIVLRVQAVALALPADSPARSKLEAVLDQADQTLGEGRDQVHELRSGPDIVASVQAAGRALEEAQRGTAFTLSVTGEPRKLQAQPGEEATEICLEALRNAYRHSGGSAVEARLSFSDARFVLRVTDNGCGMSESSVRTRIGEGHWGIVGMRERAVRIGATLHIDSVPGQGTTVELAVPSRLAYVEREDGRLLS